MKEKVVFESQYNDEMEAEVKRLEAKQRAILAGHPDWDNACPKCGCRLHGIKEDTCENCS